MRRHAARADAESVELTQTWREASCDKRCGLRETNVLRSTSLRRKKRSLIKREEWGCEEGVDARTGTRVLLQACGDDIRNFGLRPTEVAVTHTTLAGASSASPSASRRQCRHR